MRWPCLRNIVALPLVLMFASASAGEVAVRAGVIRATVAGEQPFDVLYWYPTQAAEVPWQAGPFAVPATRNAVPADGRFPLVLLSHGGGQSGGTPLLLRGLSADLARAGFVVVAPFHGKAGLQDRTLQMRAALAAVRADPRLGPHLDPSRMAMVGFSLGGAVTLQLAGAVPNPALLARYCESHPGDAMSCAHAPDGRDAVERADSEAPASSRPIVPSLKAIVLLDPFAVLYRRAELRPVGIPVLVLRPEQSRLPAEPNALSLVSALPVPPAFQEVPGGHFVFADVCPAALAGSAEVCEDPPGVDRAGVQRAVARRVEDFLRQYLGARMPPDAAGGAVHGQDPDPRAAP